MFMLSRNVLHVDVRQNRKTLIEWFGGKNEMVKMALFVQHEKIFAKFETGQLTWELVLLLFWLP